VYFVRRKVGVYRDKKVVSGVFVRFSCAASLVLFESQCLKLDFNKLDLKREKKHGLWKIV
jgi:hypothetical protein